MSTALIVKLVFISVSSGTTNLAQCRPNLPESFTGSILLTSHALAHILTLDVMRHYAGMVRDKTLEM